MILDQRLLKHIWKTISLFGIIFLIATALLFLVALAHYWQVTLKERTDFENNETSIVLQGKTAIQQQLAGVVSDINYLAAYGTHYQTIYGGAFSLFGSSEKQKQALTKLLKIFSQEKKIYDQIRFLDTQGAEVIRINYNEGIPYSVAEHNLQEKASRYYIHEVQKLKPDELYVSPLDLNIEKGEIEQPYKPVLRFGKTVFNIQGEPQGSLFLNFMGNELLNAFNNATKPVQTHIMLLNSDGYWLSSPDKSQEWGFMLAKQPNFTTQYPEAWNTISKKLSGQFSTENQFYTFTTVSPMPEFMRTAVTPSWKVVSVIPSSNLSFVGVFDKYVTLYGSILLLLAVGSWLLASTIIRNRQSELQVTFEQRFRQILEHVDLLAISLDRNGDIIFCNEALSQLSGWSRDELLGKNWFDICVADQYRSHSRQIMLDLISGKVEEVHEDELIKTQTGETRKIEWNHTVMKDPEGEVLGLTYIGENVTDIRAQEKQLLTLSRAIEQSPVMVMIVDTKGGIQYVNPRFTEVTGYTLDEVQGKNPNLLKSQPHNHKVNYDDLWKSIKDGKSWHGIFRNKKKNAEIYWASATISGIRDNNGNIVNYIGVQEDITERLNLEQKFRMSVEGSPYAIVMSDAEGKIILINSRTEKYFGYRRDELIGQAIEILIPDRYQVSHTELRQHFAKEQEMSVNRSHGVGRNLAGKRKDGSIFPVEIALNLIDTDDGQITLASVIDITQRHKLEAELKQRDGEITRSKTLAIVGRMASMVAHDLRNPLSSIKMGLQILSKPAKKGTAVRTADQNRELRKIALEQVGYMESILEDLLIYARPAALKLEWLRIDDILNTTINMLQGHVQKHQVIININIQKGLPTLYADSGKLRQIFSNLVSNAIQATSESGIQPIIRIDVMSRLGDSTPTIQVEISDNGPGIDDKNIEQLFEPFYTTRTTGSGLGLAIVKRLTEQHQGKIKLHAKSDQRGTLCTVLLPISKLLTVEKDTSQDSSKISSQKRASKNDGYI